MSDDDDIQEYSRPCKNCEYHRKRAQFWRDEAYRQAGHPLPERGWVGLTDEEIESAIPYKNLSGEYYYDDVLNIVLLIQAKLKRKNI